MFGAAPSSGPVYGGHHPKFDLDENALPVTMSVMARAAMVLLDQAPRKKI